MNKYQQAKKRAEAKIGFYIHAIIFAGVNSLLFLIDILASPEKLWFYWPLMGWGSGLLLHFIGVFYLPQKKPPHGSKKEGTLKDRLIAKELEAMKKAEQADCNKENDDKPNGE